MSSPAVSGILALMLQANPTLDPAQVKSILYSTAITDAYTGVVPNNDWGWGKINAYGAVASALTITGIYHQEQATLEALLYPNPARGNYNLELQAEQDETMQVTLIDISGRILENQAWEVVKGVNTLQPDWDYLSAGIYFINIKGKSGEMNIRLVKE